MNDVDTCIYMTDDFFKQMVFPMILYRYMLKFDTPQLIQGSQTSAMEHITSIFRNI